MEQNELRHIIEQSREMFKNRDSFWASPLINKLEFVHSGLGLKWGFFVLKNLLPILYPEGHSVAQSFLDDFPVEASEVNIQFCKAKSEEVWSSFQPRDEIITAISDLYGALGNKLTGNSKYYLMCLASALGNISDHKCFYFECVIDFFKRLLEEAEQKRGM